MIGIILDTNGDFALQGGRIALAEADLQTADNIIRASRGEFKEAPLVGGEVLKMLGGQPSRMWCVDVAKMMKSVGLDGASVAMNNKEIVVKL